MPRVNIREIDNTGVATGTNIENIAFLPALKLEGYTQDGRRFEKNSHNQTEGHKA